MNRVKVGSAVWGFAGALAATANAQSTNAQVLNTSVPRQSVSGALQDWAEQTGWQLFYDPRVAANHESNGAPGALPAVEALVRILDGTGLTYRFLNDRTISIVPAVEASAVPASYRFARLDANGLDAAAEESRASSSATATSAGESSDSETLSTRADEFAQVVVTAQKRSERLQDVPVAVTSITADSLLNGNQLRLQDYSSRIPGLNVTPDDLAGGPKVTIRGITTGGSSNPSVAIVVDDVPYGSSVGISGGYRAPDIDPSDLERVEVLRGPQGTLYGAASLGGLIKYVTVDPSTEGMSGRVQGGLNNIYNGDSLGYNARAAINLPLGDTFAVRTSGFTRMDPGYIDDVNSGTEGVNQRNVSGGRVSAMWKPSRELSVKLSALYQDNSADGLSLVSGGLGDLEQSLVPGVGAFDETVQVYSATVTARVANIDLASISGYSLNERDFSFDLSPLIGGTMQTRYGVRGAPSAQHNETTKFTQEFRLSAPIGERFDWLLGAFYNHEDSPADQVIWAANFNTGVPVATFSHNEFPSKFEERAAFVDLNFHLTDRFDIQLGGRQSENRQTFSQANLLTGVTTLRLTHTKEDSFTYLVTPKFQISSDLMVYATTATGFRPGGPNTNLVGIPPTYKHDTTQNYEVGIKGTFLDRSLFLDASVYYIDWKDIQLQLFNPSTGQGYRSNGSRAKSQGVELAIESRPLERLSIGGWVAWNDAVLSEDMPRNSTVQGVSLGISGDRLPHSSRWSGSVSVDQEFPLLNSGAMGFVSGSVSYVGDRYGVFNLPRREIFPSYAQTNLSTGFRYDTWTANLFVNNLTDKRGVVGGGAGTGFLLNAYTYIQPRTIGLTLTKTF